jgi:hypothetical protein
MMSCVFVEGGGGIARYVLSDERQPEVDLVRDIRHGGENEFLQTRARIGAFGPGTSRQRPVQPRTCLPPPTGGHQSHSHYVHFERHSCLWLEVRVLVLVPAGPGAREPEQAHDEHEQGGVEAALGLGSQHGRVGWGSVHMVLWVRAREERGL